MMQLTACMHTINMTCIYYLAHDWLLYATLYASTYI